MVEDLDEAAVRTAIQTACLAPSIYNIQPWRWKIAGGVVWLAADLTRHLPQADPGFSGMGLSCGAALEAFALAMSSHGLSVDARDCWHEDDRSLWPGHRLAAQIAIGPEGAPDPIAQRLDQRFTWRGAFDPDPVSLFGWSRADALFVTDAPGKAWLSALNDTTGLSILRGKAFRAELLRWMRLRPNHPRAGKDGMDLAALRMTPQLARWVRLAFGPLWPLLDLTGQTRAMTAEAAATQSATLIALFYRPVAESPVTAGRAYLRLWLEAASLGMAGWPMAALTDDPPARATLAARFGLGPDRRVLQAIRFGRAPGPMPPRARRPLDEVYFQDRSQTGQE